MAHFPNKQVKIIKSNTQKYMKHLNLIKLILLSLTFIPFMNVKADYYTYTPDLSEKLLHVYNATLNRLVTSTVLVGSPRNVYVSHSGTKIFVSAVILERNVNQSYINVVNALSNKVEANGAIRVSGENARGLVITQDDNTLFVTHEDGVTKIERPGIMNTSTDLDLTYRGLNLTISNDDKYLFVIGTDNSNNDGISVVDIATFTEIADYSLGTGQGANEILFNNDETTPKLFVALSDADKVVSVAVNNYDDANALNLDLLNVREFTLGANPIDLQLNKNGTELFVVLNYIKDQEGTGNGNIVLLDTTDISATNTVSGIAEIFFSNELSTYSQGAVIHPLAVNIDDNGFIYVLKQIWSDKTGIYVTKLKDSTNISTGKRKIEEIQSYNLGNKVSTLANGQFLSECDVCPTGDPNDEIDFVERPAAMNWYILVFLIGLLLLLRRDKTTCK